MYIVYGKDNCKYCTQATQLLQNKGLEFLYKKLDVDYSKEQLVAIMEVFSVVPRTVPQILLSEGGASHYIGSFTDLQKTLTESLTHPSA